jgi:nicotinamide mononucleotide adenylyltransferase
MKRTILSTLIICFCIAAFAQSDKYAAAMKKNISMLDSVMQKGNMKELANNFERIAEAEKTQWLPYYYAAYCNVMNAFMEKDKSKVDAIADKAEELISKAEANAGKENSEIAVIKSMIASAHMMVDPQSRFMQYGAASVSNIEKAKALDPKNPRPVYLEGQAKIYTPEAFGGGKAVAKPILEKALAMFDTFKPETELHPAWGKSATEYFLAMANK